MLPDNHRYQRNEPESDLESAITAFEKNQPVLIHDADERENEVDLVYPAHAVTPTEVARLRNDAGGLICVALAHDVAETLDLPLREEVIEHPASRGTELEYDDRSSFSLTVNHRRTYTGITDNDRARTISELGETARDPNATDFTTEFDIPGHVHLLKAAPDLLEDRQGHTELGIALAELADVPPAVVVCEMLDDHTGGPLSKSTAASYAADHDFVLLDGATLIENYDGSE